MFDCERETQVGYFGDQIDPLIYEYLHGFVVLGYFRISGRSSFRMNLELPFPFLVKLTW